MPTRSFTLKIGADTSDFNKSLKQADKAINSTVKEGKALQESLKLKFNSQTFQTAQKVAQQALDLTNQKVVGLQQQLAYLESSGAIDTDSYYDLQIKLAQAQLKAESLNKSLQELKNMRLESVVKQIDKLGNSLTKAGNSLRSISLTATAALAGMYSLANSAVETGDEIQTLADQYSLSAEQIQKWNYIALQTDVASERMYKGISKVRDAVGTALIGGTNAATQAIEKLVGDISKLPTDSEGAFQSIVLALSRVEDSTLQAYYANEIFGEELATGLIPLLKQGSGAINELCLEFESVGYLSNEQVRSLADFDNELNKMKEQLSVAKTELGIAFLPILQTLADFVANTLVPAMKKLGEWFDNIPGGIQNAIVGFLALLAVMSPVFSIAGKIVKMFGSLISFCGNLNTHLMKLTTTAGRLGMAFGTVMTAVVLISQIFENWSGMNTIQRIIAILGTLTVVALGAAIAMGAFHSAWSLGLAVAGIIAGIVAVTAAVNAAKDDINSDIEDFSAPSISGNSGNYNIPDYASPNTNYGGSQSTTNDNSIINNNITINAENADADEIVDLLSKKLAIKVQARR